MLKKLTFFSFVSSLILLVITLLLNPFVSLNIIEGVTDSIKSCYVQNNVIIKIENINKINFEAEDNTKVKVVQTSYKSSEILIKYNSILGNISDYSYTTEDNEIFIIQNLEKNKDTLSNMLNILEKFNSVEANITIFVPQDIELNLKGNTYYDDISNSSLFEN